MTDQEGKEEELLSLLRHNINFVIIDTSSNLDNNNEVLTITLKDSQFSTSISTIYIPLGFSINTTLLSNIKNSADNVIITQNISTSTVQRRINGELHWKSFIADNIIHIYRDSRTNASDILDYIISSAAIYNNSGESGLVG